MLFFRQNQIGSGFVAPVTEKMEEEMVLAGLSSLSSIGEKVIWVSLEGIFYSRAIPERETKKQCSCSANEHCIARFSHRLRFKTKFWDSKLKSDMQMRCREEGDCCTGQRLQFTLLTLIIIQLCGHLWPKDEKKKHPLCVFKCHFKSSKHIWWL